MAINSNGALEDNKNTSSSRCSSKSSNLSSSQLVKINFARRDSCSSSKALNKDRKSPYFTNDKVQMLNRVTEKKAENRKPVEIFSSFPPAASVYKANSDEFKLKKKKGRKIKKSVLTLPNEPAPMPKTYTVSDLNDSEGFNVGNESRVNKSKKRRCMKRFKKGRMKEHAMQYYDRDARYCSQLNIDLDCSSTEVVNFTGDGNKVSELKYKSNNSGNSCNDDVWSVLRNINKFQFIPSSASQESVVPLRKRRPIIKKNNHCNDTHFIETCHTEEFSYISSFETHGSCSPSSSFDRVTVIDKNSEKSEIIKQLRKNIFRSNLTLKDKLKNAVNSQLQQKNKLKLKNYNKKVPQNKKKNEEKLLLGNSAYEKIPLEERGNESTCMTLLSPGITEHCKTSDLLKPIEVRAYSDNTIKENDKLSNDLINNSQHTDRFVDDKKLNYPKPLTKSPNVKVDVMKPIGESEKQLSGITKVIFSKGREIVTPKFLELQRRPRLALTLPNANIPKLSQFEIRRRLANQKFPIIILGKDQITNQGIFVPKPDPLQFDGLDNHIWPFMLEWSEQRRSVNVQNNQNKETIKAKHLKDKHKLSYRNDVISKIDNNKENSINSHVVNKKADSSKKIKINTMPTINYPTKFIDKVSSQVAQRPKPLFLLRNKMFQLLQKNAIDNLGNNWSNKRIAESIGKHKRVGTNEIPKNLNNPNRNLPNTVSVKEVPDKPVDNRIVKKSYSSLQNPWAKGKWASDFIENIIKKIKSGVYYGVDRMDKTYRINGTEVSTQTEVYISKNAYCQNSDETDSTLNLTFAKDAALTNIPGFDNTLTTLEIETITSNTIAVKHCISNVVVQFDIQVMNDPNNFIQSKNKSMSCIPINLKNKQEKVFKCNTSIINAFLPAELCSIIPTMMQSILDDENNLKSQPTNINPNFIAKSSESESTQKIINSILTRGAMSVNIKSMLNAWLPEGYLNKSISNKLFLATKDISVSLGEENITKKILCQFNQPTVILHLSHYNINNDKPNVITNKPMNSCMALALYEPKKHSIIPYKGLFRIIDFMKKIVDKQNQNHFNKITMIFNDLCNNKSLVTGRILLPRCENQTIMCLPPRMTVGVISLFNAFEKNHQCICKDNKDVKPFNSIGSVSETENTLLTASDERTSALRRKPQPVKALRKKSYVRCYRKCKSMSSISSVKSTPLNRVTNLHEFCQVLGSNAFSSVLDGCPEKNLLGAVEEMKNWITDLSPKQALLVLLLTNKKDTPNLIRFRPVLLQGIAVNRITKAVELDTEIEVIEREHFYKRSQASDYQKTFDESSEKLLKSLLEKRKKLNPSYLRVMARYVGLGLLAPKK